MKTVAKVDTPLKSIPPAVKKDKKIAELMARVADVTKQATSIRQSLEAAMCRGDTFTGDELRQWCGHALALFGSRVWDTREGVFKVFHAEELTAHVGFRSYATTPAEVEGWTIDGVLFTRRDDWKPIALIDGRLAQYSIHLGSGVVHKLPGGALCIVPVHAQQRGRLFLPFADDAPRTAEVISKTLLLARDHEIQDPNILEQIR